MDIADDWNEEEEDVQMDAVMETSGTNEIKDKRPLLMKFCPHDSSMLYPKVSWKVIVLVYCFIHNIEYWL
jgi:hypothetical protein